MLQFAWYYDNIFSPSGKKGHWSVISSLLEHKTDVQCYERWHKVIEPMWRRRRGNVSDVQLIVH